MNDAVNQVLVVEDDSDVRSRICDAIESEPQLNVMAAVGTIHAARSVLGRRMPRLALVDLELPDDNGSNLIRWLASQDAQVDSLVLTVFGDERNVVSAIEAGAAGYLLKGEDSDNVAPMLLRLLRGESPISPAVARHILARARRNGGQAQDTSKRNTDARQNATQQTAERLTPTEFEVLRLIAKGYTGPEIAAMTDRSPNTIPVHIRNIYRKLAVHNRAEAVYEAMQMGLIDTVGKP